MAKQSIGLGSVADDGTGDTLRIAGDKVNDNFDELYTTLGDGSTLTAPATTASPTFTGTIVGATLDLSGNLTVGDDVSLDSDAAVLNFGANSEVSLTHVHDTGLLLNSTSVIQFNDASQNIGAPSTTVLDINATDEVEINATELEFNGTTADINANLDVSGTITGGSTYTGAGLMTTGGNIVIPDAGNIGSASDTDSMAIASTGIVTFSQIPSVPINTIEISTQTRGSFLVMEAGGTDGAGANAGDNIIDETDSDDIIHESATDLVGSVFNIIDSTGMVVRTINSV
jgi:hypothetical protein